MFPKCFIIKLERKKSGLFDAKDIVFLTHKWDPCKIYEDWWVGMKRLGLSLISVRSWSDICTPWISVSFSRKWTDWTKRSWIPVSVLSCINVFPVRVVTRYKVTNWMPSLASLPPF
jgi:hypothetical protein